MHCEPVKDRLTRHATMPLLRRSPWLRLLSQVLELAGGKADLIHHAERSWASATFAGSRHTIALAFEGTPAIAAGECFIAALPEHEFTVSGQLVADAFIVEADHALVPHPCLTVTAELLLLEDA